MARQQLPLGKDLRKVDESETSEHPCSPASCGSRKAQAPLANCCLLNIQHLACVEVVESATPGGVAPPVLRVAIERVGKRLGIEGGLEGKIRAVRITLKVLDVTICVGSSWDATKCCNKKVEGSGVRLQRSVAQMESQPATSNFTALLSLQPFRSNP
jgi:hypothetical protein